MATATYMYRDANGKIHGIKATSKANADAAWSQLHETSPLMFEKPGVAAALREIEKRYPEKQKLPFGLPDPSAMSERMVESATLGGYGYGTRRLAQARVAMQRNLPGGDKLPYTADDYYRASQLFDAARRKKDAAENPKSAFVSDVLGAAVMPGGPQILRKGKKIVGALPGVLDNFITGSKATRLMAEGARVPLSTRLGQATRLSGTTGAMTAVQAAAQARPDEAKKDAVAQGLVGAALAPVVAMVPSAAVNVARSGKDLVSRIVQPRTAQQLAAEKLQTLLQKAQVTPALIRTALDEFSQTGSVSPTVYDVLRKAGASPDVLGLFRAKGSYPETRALAQKYADKMTGDVQSRALEATRKLPTSGETRTPSQIREAQAAEAARVKQETEQAMADATRTTEQATAGVAPAPTGPERGSGARELYADLNTLYDTNVKAYTEAFANARKANPQSAIIADDQRTPLRTTLYQAVSPFLNPDLKSTITVAKMFDNLTEGMGSPSQTRLPDLPADVQKYLASFSPADRPKFEANMRKSLKLDTPVEIPGEIPADARPLTVAELFGKRTALVELANNFTKSGDNQAAGAANAAKSALDAELTRLFNDGHIQGDPEVLNLWNQGLQGFAQTQEIFGKGIAKDLVERIPGKPDQNVIRPYQAGDVIFGKGTSPRNLNDIRADLEPVTAVVPNAVTAVQRELYTRVKPENLPEAEVQFNEVFGDLLPRDLTDAAAAARQKAAQVEAQNTKLLADTEAQNAQLLASTEAQQARTSGAMGLGESLRTMPSEQFVREVTNVPQDLKPLVQAGGRQKLLDTLERPEPGSTGLLGDLQSTRDTSNLAAMYGDEGAELQRTLKGIEEQTQGAQELSLVTGNQAPGDETFVSSPRDLLSARWLLADKLLAKLRQGINLSPEESVGLFNLMKSQGAPDLNALADMARVDTVGPKGGITVPIAKAFAAPAGDKKSLDELREQYGLNY